MLSIIQFLSRSRYSISRFLSRSVGPFVADCKEHATYGDRPLFLPVCQSLCLAVSHILYFSTVLSSLVHRFGQFLHESWLCLHTLRYSRQTLRQAQLYSILRFISVIISFFLTVLPLSLLAVFPFSFPLFCFRSREQFRFTSPCLL